MANGELLHLVLYQAFTFLSFNQSLKQKLKMAPTVMFVTAG